VPIGDQYNTRIIVDDFVNWGATLALSLLYIRCQLTVCQAYRLSLSLKKMRIFPKRFEFVGVDVTPGGNLPAQSKRILLETWPKPVDVRDLSPSCRRHVGDMSATRHNVGLFPSDTRVDPTQKSPRHTQFISISADSSNQLKRTKYCSYHRVFVFELNCVSVCRPTCREKPTCRVVLDTLADTKLCRVADMTRTCRRHVADTTQLVGVWANKSTRRHST